MAKKSTPIDTAMIERASRFDVTIFLGKGKYRTEPLSTLVEARQRAPSIAAEVSNGRRAMIYAVTPEGRSTFVPDSYRPTEAQAAAEAAQAPEEIPAAFVAALGPRAAGRPAEGPDRPKTHRPLGKRSAALADAERGVLPAAPDFSAETHKRFRGKLAEVVAMAEASDIAGLEAFKINPVSSSPKAIDKYRGLCVIALKARAGAKKGPPDGRMPRDRGGHLAGPLFP